MTHYWMPVLSTSRYLYNPLDNPAGYALLAPFYRWGD